MKLETMAAVQTEQIQSGSPSGMAVCEPVTHPDNVNENRQLFFAKVSKAAGEDEIKTLFSEYGKVRDVIIFQSSQGSMTSKGCGLVTMSTHAEAAAAIQGLHGKFAWSNRDPPMVVTWMDSALQDPARQQHLQASKLGVKPAGNKSLLVGMGDPMMNAMDPGSADLPPAGCDPDAVKLFVGNIPLAYSEEQLLPVFQTIGPVVELVVVRNKQSSMSKGCAFVWYAKREHAEAAITQLNLQHVLTDMTGQQNRPLVVRKARTGHIMQLPNMGKQSSGNLAVNMQAAMANGGAVDQMALENLAAAAGLRGGLGQRMLQHQLVMQSGTGMGQAAPMSTPQLGGARPALGGLAQRIIGSSSMLNSAFVPPAQSAPSLSATSASNSSSLAMRLQSVPTNALGGTNYGGSLAHSLASQQQGQQIMGSQGRLGSQNMLGSQSMLGSQGLLDIQPVTVHTLPGGTYVSSSGLGSVQAVLGTAPSGTSYQLVMDLPPPSSYDLQSVGALSGDGGVDAFLQQRLQQAVSAQQAAQAPAETYSHGTVMALDTLQLSAVNDHLYSIQACTGAQVMVSPGAPGMFNMLLSGSQQQVDQARIMIASLLNIPL